MTPGDRNTFLGNFRALAERLADKQYQLENWTYEGRASRDMEGDLDDLDEVLGVGPADAADHIVRWRFEFGEDLMLSSVLVAARVFTLFPGNLASANDVATLLTSDEMEAVRDAVAQLVTAIDARIASSGPDLPTPGG